MAYPTLRDRATSVDTSVSGGVVDIDLPVLETGDLLLAHTGIRVAFGSGVTWPTGWTEIVNEERTPQSWIFSVAVKMVDGTEGYTGDGTDTIEISVGDTADLVGATSMCDSYSDAKYLGVTSYGSVVGVDTLDLPSLDVGTSAKIRWVLVAATQGYVTQVAAWPVSYSLSQLHYKASPCSVLSSARELEASSTNPGFYYFDEGDYMSGATVAIGTVAKGGGFGAFGL